MIVFYWHKLIQKKFRPFGQMLTNENIIQNKNNYDIYKHIHNELTFTNVFLGDNSSFIFW